MRKKSLVFFVAVFLILSLSVSLVSASWFSNLFKWSGHDVVNGQSKCQDQGYQRCDAVGDCCDINCNSKCTRFQNSGGNCCYPKLNNQGTSGPNVGGGQESGKSFGFSNFFNRLKGLFGLSGPGGNNEIIYYDCQGPNIPNPTKKENITVIYSEDGGLTNQTQTLSDVCTNYFTRFKDNKSSTLGEGNEGTGTINGPKNTKYVKDYFCKNIPPGYPGGPLINPVSTVIPCDVGKHCENGACVGGLTCNDTDGGKNYNTAGTVYGWDSFAHAYATKSDYCIGDELTEYSCAYTGEIETEAIVCPHGCDDYGACIDPATIGNSGNCSDSDLGINAVTMGTVEGSTNSLWIQTPFTDTCTMYGFNSNLSDPAIIEGYCGNDGTAHSITIKCDAGCSNSTNGIGYCNQVSGASGCSDTDNGLNYTSKGTVAGTHYGLNGWSLTDSCYIDSRGNQYVKEGYCDVNGQANFEYHQCPVDCFDGTCVGDENATVYDCTDTDGGENFYLNGTATGMHYGDPYYSETDRCYGDYLVEAYCDRWGNVKLENFVCPTGYSCFDGACVLGGNKNSGGDQNNLQKNFQQMKLNKLINSIPNIRYKN